MPNHIHGIILLSNEVSAPDPVGATRRVARSPETTLRHSPRPSGPAAGSLAAIIGQFKSVTTKRAKAMLGAPHPGLWQRNYYEHIIRNDRSLRRLRDYIAANPARWPMDQLHPDMAQMVRGTPWRAPIPCGSLSYPA